MKSPCCNKEMLSYTAKDFPFESGYRCTCCGLQLSHLQISRGGLKEKCNLKDNYD